MTTAEISRASEATQVLAFRLGNENKSSLRTGVYKVENKIKGFGDKEENQV